jgi:hypothetical protein
VPTTTMPITAQRHAAPAGAADGSCMINSWPESRCAGMEDARRYLFP